jgi:hypothetical protein
VKPGRERSCSYACTPNWSARFSDGCLSTCTWSHRDPTSSPSPIACTSTSPTTGWCGTVSREWLRPRPVHCRQPTPSRCRSATSAAGGPPATAGAAPTITSSLVWQTDAPGAP